MIGRNIAPGLNRDFASMEWPQLPLEIWSEAIQSAKDAITHEPLKLFASDISKGNLSAAKANAEKAGVTQDITFKVSDFRKIRYQNNFEVIITNPPYGERLNDQKEYELKQLYRDLGNITKKMKTISKYVITSFEGFENLFEAKASKVRVLYNGKIKARYYQYYGPKPK